MKMIQEILTILVVFVSLVWITWVLTTDKIGEDSN